VDGAHRSLTAKEQFVDDDGAAAAMQPPRFRSRHRLWWDDEEHLPMAARVFLTQMFDWTDGCIAVTNAEMDDIWDMVPNNTAIEINP
jgi:hypothetical protein